MVGLIAPLGVLGGGWNAGGLLVGVTLALGLLIAYKSRFRPAHAEEPPLEGDGSITGPSAPPTVQLGGDVNVETLLLVLGAALLLVVLREMLAGTLLEGMGRFTALPTYNRTVTTFSSV